VTLLLVLVAGTAWWFVVAAWKPAPPRTLRMAAGPAGSAYADYAARYRDRLARAGIRLELVETAGAVANLRLLRDGASGTSAGFVQAGTTTAAESPELVSLGTVFYEPLWLFERGLDTKAGFAAFLGRRLSIGREGSGTRALVLRVLGLGGIGLDEAELLALSPEEAADRLEGGTIDAAAIVTSWESPVVRRLLAAPGITLVSFPRADAYVALLPYLTRLSLPSGVADLGRNLPPGDVVLVAPKASLAVRRDLHPALQYLLLDAAVEIHAAPGIFQRASEFPAPEAGDLPLAPEALQFQKAGRPFLQRHLPFWLAVFVERLGLALVPVVGALYPLARLVPALRGWYMRRRVALLYGELKLLELAIDGGPTPVTRDELLARLDELEARASHLRLPKGFAALAYSFQHHIRLVRERLRQSP
jgi:TRAP-type uncharacterized transport system substrate-binding protein